MSRWARSFWNGNKSRLSPFGSRSCPPNVTEDDYSYITSGDLTAPGRTYDPSRKPPLPQSLQIEDDVLLARSKGVIYPVKFPANSIESGNLKVCDVKEYVASVMELPKDSGREIKIIHQGEQLEDNLKSCRDCGLKNHSEILCIIDDSPRQSLNQSDCSGDGSESVESTKKRRNRGKKGKKTAIKKKIVSSNNHSDVGSSSTSPPRPKIQGPIEKLDIISNHFRTKIVPLCVQFTVSPPEDEKKKDYEHKKLSETIMNEVLLKLDAVETEGDNDARDMRRALVREVQDVLNNLDNALK